MVRCFLLLLTLAGLGAAEPVGLDRPVSVNLWSDRPSEALAEIMVNLPQAERFAWYVQPALDQDLYPGCTIERRNEPVRQVLDAYCALAKLQWKAAGRHVWLFRPVEAAQVAGWAKALTGESAKDRRPAGEQLRRAATPESLAALVAAAGHADPAVAAVAREQLAQFLGVPAWGLQDLTYTAKALFGDLDQRLPRQLNLAPVADYGPAEIRFSPWAALRVLFQDPTAAALVPPALAATPKLLTDVPMLIVGAAARSPLVQEPLAVWGGLGAPAGKAKPGDDAKNAVRPLQIDGPPWIVSHVGRRAKEVAAWIGETPAPAAVDVAAKAAALLAAIAATDKKSLDKGTQDLGKAKGQIIELGRLRGDPPAEALIKLAGHEHELIREEVARSLGNFRQAAVVAPLAKLMQQENEDQPRVRTAAAVSLGRTRLPEAAVALKAGAVNPNSPQTRLDATRALAENRVPGTYELIKERLVEVKEPAERNVLIQLLGFTRSPKAIEDLLALTAATVALEDRVSAAAGLIAVPTDAARKRLGELLTSKDDRGLRLMTIKGLTPRSVEDARRYAPLLVTAVANETDEEVGLAIVKAMGLAADYTQKADPERVAIAYAALRLVQNHANSNIRSEAIETFRHTGANAAIVKALEAVRDGLNNPVLKMKISNSLKLHMTGKPLDLPEEAPAP